MNHYRPAPYHDGREFGCPPPEGLLPSLTDLEGLLPNDPRPERIYHYTTLAGLKGILESGTFWATGFEYMNDATEIRYTYGLSREVAEGLAATGGFGAHGLAFLEGAGTIQPWRHEIFVACFSELEDDLGQWRAYGGRQGVSIGVPCDIGEPEIGRIPAGLVQVLYDQAKQKEYLRACLAAYGRAADRCSDYDTPADQVLHYLIKRFEELIGGVAYFFKDPAFELEREWRYVVMGYDKSPKARVATPCSR